MSITYPILETRRESKKVTSFILPFSAKVIPGQFVMAWVPGAGEIPLSIAWAENKKIELAVAAVGTVSKAMCKLKKGNVLGLRGPFGNGFTLKGNKRIALIAGGYGIAPLTMLAKEAKTKGITSDLFFGARTKDDLILIDRAKKYANVFCTTNDGSCGHEGLVVDPLKEQLEKEKYDYVYTVGPELMMKAAFDICVEKNIPIQASIERYMKCGVGICDSCSINGQISCVDGPIFEREELETFTEFGKTHRGPSGMPEEY